MNHIFRVIFDKTKGMLVVVSELARNQGKEKSSQLSREASPKVNPNIFRISTSALLTLLTSSLLFSSVAQAEWVVMANGSVSTSGSRDGRTGPINAITLNPNNGSQYSNGGENRQDGVAIGTEASVRENGGVAVGRSAQVRLANGVAIGNGAKVETFIDNSEAEGIAIGKGANAKGQQAVVLGANSGAVSQATAIGTDVFAQGGSSIAIGNDDLIGSSNNLQFRDTLPLKTIESIYDKLWDNNGGRFFANKDSFLSKYSGSNAIYSPTYAKELGAIAIGSRTVAAGEVSTALGSLSFALANRSTAVGIRSFVSTEAEGGTAIGERSRVFAQESVAIGNLTESTSRGSMSYGYKAKAVGNNSIAIGSQVAANAAFDISKTSVLIEAYRNLARSNGAETDYNNFESVLDGTLRDGLPVLSEGVSYLTTKDSSGRNVEIKKTKKIADNAIAIGSKTFAVKKNSVAIGYAALADADNSFAVGSYSSVKTGSDNTIALGVGAYAEGTDSFVAGTRSRTGSNNTLVVGSKALIQSNANNSVALGTEANVKIGSEQSIALGYKAEAGPYAVDSLALGTKSKIYGYVNGTLKIENAIALGNSATVTYNANDTVNEKGMNAMAIGTGAYATLNNSIALGVNSKTDYGYANLEKPGWVSKGAISIPTSGKTGVISVGGKGTERRIVNVASGALDTDAVNVAQLKTIEERFEADIAALTSGGGVQYLSFEKKNINGQAGNLARQIEQENNYKQFVNLQTQLLYFEARQKLNGERFQEENLNKLRNRMTQLDQNGSFANLASKLKEAKDELSRAATGENKTLFDSIITKIGEASLVDVDKSPSNLSPEEIENLKKNNNYLNDGAQGIDSIAFGWKAKTNGNENGDKGKQSIAIGFEAGGEDGTTGLNSIAIGTKAETNGDNAIAIGYLNKANSKNAIAIGSNLQVTGNNSGAIGNPSTVSGSGSYSIGNDNKIFSDNTFVLGNNVTASTARSVFLGNKSALVSNSSKGATASYTTQLVEGLTYGSFTGNSVGVVSVGNDTEARRVQGVAPGLIASNSTDAINGSQLYTTNTVLGRLATAVKNNFGGNADLKSAQNEAGNIIFTNIGGTGKNNINDAIAASREEVVGTVNYVDVTKATQTDGHNKYTVSLATKVKDKIDNLPDDTNAELAKKATKDLDNITNTGKDNITKLVTASSNDAYTTVTPTGGSNGIAKNFKIGVNVADTIGSTTENNNKLASTNAVRTAILNAKPSVVAAEDSKEYLTVTGEKSTDSLSGDTFTVGINRNKLIESLQKAEDGFTRLDGSNLSTISTNPDYLQKWKNALGIGDGVNWVNVRSTKPSEDDLVDSNYDKSHSGAKGADSIAVGNKAIASNKDGIAIGHSTRAAGDGTIAIGSNIISENYNVSNVANSGVNAIVIGNGAGSKAGATVNDVATAQPLGASSVAIGQNAYATQLGSIALGWQAAATANSAQAFGGRATASGNSSIAIGTNSVASGVGSLALGRGSKVSEDNSVALGSGSTTAAAVATTEATIEGLNFKNFAGTAPSSTVSVGTSGRERTITNVAAGRIAANSTDAINGSQLYATNAILGKLATSVKNYFGGNAELDANTGEIKSWTNIGGTGKTNIDDAIKASREVVEADVNGGLVVTPSDLESGAKKYTVKIDDDLKAKIDNLPTNTTQALGEKADKGLSNLTDDGKNVITGLVNVTTKAGSSDKLTVSSKVDTTTRVKTFEINLDDSNYANISLGNINDAGKSVIKGLVEGKVADDSVSFLTVTNTDGDKKEITYGLTKAALDKLNAVDAASGVVKANQSLKFGGDSGETNAQLFSKDGGLKFNIVKGDASITTKANGDNITIAVSDKGITTAKIADGAVTEAKLDSALSGKINSGLNFAGNTGTTFNRALGNTVNIKGVDNGYITTTANTDTITIDLNQTAKDKLDNLAENPNETYAALNATNITGDNLDKWRNALGGIVFSADSGENTTRKLGETLAINGQSGYIQTKSEDGKIVVELTQAAKNKLDNVSDGKTVNSTQTIALVDQAGTSSKEQTLDAEGGIKLTIANGDDSIVTEADATTSTVKVKVKDGGISTDKLADSAVTKDKLATDAVETDKIKDGAVTGAKIADGTITAAKLDSTFKADVEKAIALKNQTIKLTGDSNSSTANQSLGQDGGISFAINGNDDIVTKASDSKVDLSINKNEAITEDNKESTRVATTKAVYNAILGSKAEVVAKEDADNANNLIEVEKTEGTGIAKDTFKVSLTKENLVTNLSDTFAKKDASGLSEGDIAKWKKALSLENVSNTSTLTYNVNSVEGGSKTVSFDKGLDFIGDKNITTSIADGGKVNFALKDTLTGITNITNGSKVDDTGVTTLNISDAGLTLNDKNIKGVKAGSDDKDAVNVAQLKALATTLGGSVDNKGNVTGPTFDTKVEGSGKDAAPTATKGAIDDLITAVNKGLNFGADLADPTNKKLGQQIDIKSGDITDNNISYKAKNLKTKVSGGNILIGLNEAPEFKSINLSPDGTNKITLTPDDKGNLTISKSPTGEDGDSKVVLKGIKDGDSPDSAITKGTFEELKSKIESNNPLNGKDGTNGLPGKDGLNNKPISDKVEALRDGVAGNVVYTKEDGTRLVFDHTDGKYYELDPATGKKKADAEEVPANQVILSSVNPDGTTTKPVTLGNLASALGVDLEANPLAAVTNDDAKAKVTDLLTKADKASLSKAATAADLQVLAQAGINFLGNEDATTGTIHKTLGSTLSIEGKDNSKYGTDGYEANKYSANNLITHKDGEKLRIEFLKAPTFTALTLDNGEEDPNNAKVTLTPTKDANGNTILNLSNGKDGKDGRVVITGVKDGDSPDSVVSKGTLDAVIGKNGLSGVDGKNGINGQTVIGQPGVPGKDGANGSNGLNNPGGQDGQNGTTLANKVQALRNGISGTVVYTDAQGNRLLAGEDGKYYPTSVVGEKVKAINGLWYDRNQLNDDGTLKENVTDADGKTITTLATESSVSPLSNSDVILSAVDSEGNTKEPIKLANLASALGNIAGENEDAKLADVQNKVAKLLASQNKDGESLNLSRVATAADLQVLAKAGLDFTADDNNTVHKNLGEKLAILGQSTGEGDNKKSYIETSINDGKVNIKLSDEVKAKLDGISGDGKLVYKANGKGITDNADANKISLADGLNFSDGTNTTATIEEDGVVKYSVNPDLKGITSIGNGSDGNEAKLTFNAGSPAGETGEPAAVAPSIEANNVKLTGLANGEIAKGSTDAITGDQLNTLAEKIGIAKDGSNGINGVDGKDKDGDSKKDYGVPKNGTDGKNGPASRDGLNGTTLANKVQGLRDGIAGTVVYTDEAGNRILAENGKYYKPELVENMRKANDGLWYPADKVKEDGTVDEADKALGKSLKELAETNADKVLSNDKVILSTVNPDGTTTEPVRLSNIANVLGGTPTATTDKTKDEVAAEKIVELLGKTPQNNKLFLSRVVTAADLQVLAEAGINFLGNQTDNSTNRIHKILGSTLSIEGKSGVNYDDDGVAAKYSADNLITHKTTDGKLRIEFLKAPTFNALTLDNGKDEPNNAKVILTPTKDDKGNSTLNLSNGKDGQNGEDTKVVISGIKDGEGPDSAVTKGSIDKIIEKIGTGKDGINGIDGREGKDGDNGKDYGIPKNGEDGKDGPASRDGLNGTTLANKVQGLRDGVAGTVVYTDESGNRLLVENGKYYTTATVEGKRKANDGLWYDAADVNEDGSVKEKDPKAVGSTLKDLANGDATKVLSNDKVILSTVNPDGTTTEPVRLSNIANVLGGTPTATTDKTKDEVAAEKIAELLGKTPQNDKLFLSRAVTAADLQVLAEAGINFLGNQTDNSTNRIHKVLGTTLSIEGKDGLNYDDNGVAAKYSADNLITHKTTDGKLRIEFLKAPTFNALTLDNGKDEPNNAKVILTPTKDDKGNSTLNLSNGKDGTNGENTKVVISGIKDGEGPDSAVTKGAIDKLIERIGAGTNGINGIDGRDGANGTDGTKDFGVPTNDKDVVDGKKDPAGRDGLNGTTLANKVQGLRDGIAGTVVYTDADGNRVLAENGAYYKADLVANKKKANDGLWYAANKVAEDGSVITLENGTKPTGSTLKQLAANNADKVLQSADVRLSAVNADGRTTEPTVLANIADGKIAEGSKEAVNGGQLYSLATALGTNIADNGTITQPTINAIKGVDGGNKTKQPTNIVDAVNDVIDTVNSGLTFSDGTTNGKQQLGSKVTIKGNEDNTLTADKVSTDNVKVTYTNEGGNGTFKVALKKDAVFDTVAAGDPNGDHVVLDGNSITGKKAATDPNDPNAKPVTIGKITLGKDAVTLSKGADNAPVKLTGIAAGENDNDAVNKKQVDDAIKGVTDTLDKGLNVATEGMKTADVEGGVSKQNLALGNTVKVKDGINTTVSKVEKEVGADGNATGVFNYTINVNGLPMTYVNSGNKPIAKLGNDFYLLKENGEVDTEAGVQKVAGMALVQADAPKDRVGNAQTLSNVADGHKDTDAVNVRQLKAARSEVVSDSKNLTVSKDQKPDGSSVFRVGMKPDIEVDTLTLGKGAKSTLSVVEQEVPEGARSKAISLGIEDIRITNVADGVFDNDAVNVGQLRTAMAEIDHKVAVLDNKINNVNRDLRAGVASALAAASLPQATEAGNSMIAVAGGTYGGESAVSLGVSKISDNGRLVIKVTGTSSSRGKVGAGAGVGYQWK